MRVLLFHFAQLGAVGGVEAVTLMLASGLRKRDCATGIVESLPRQGHKRLLDDHIPVWGVVSSTLPVRYRPRSWASFLRATLHFCRAVREFKPHIVHVHYPAGQSIPVVGADFLPHTWRLVVTLHGSDVRSVPAAEPGLVAWQGRLLERASVVTAVSRGLLREALSLFPSIAEKARVIPNGVSDWWVTDGARDSRPEVAYALFVGRLHEVKGVDLLLQAWQLAGPKLPGIQLWIAGDGPTHASLVSQVSALGLSSSVRFLGSKTREELRSLFSNAEVVVMPSRNEGSPLTLLEAKASGSVCVATRVSGIAEIIEDGVSGFLVEPESPAALAMGMLRALSLPSERRLAIKRAAQARVHREFTEDKMIEAYLSVYSSLLSKR